MSERIVTEDQPIELTAPDEGGDPPATDVGGDAVAEEPRRYSGRIRALDLARAIAIFGMFYAHVGPKVDYGNNDVASFLEQIPHGRSSILFALLAGVSLAILTGRNVPYTGWKLRNARTRILGRALALMVFATVANMLGTPVAVILDYYAVWFILAIPFVSWSRRKLMVAAGVTAIAGPILVIVIPWLVSSLGMTSWSSGLLVYDTLMVGTYPGLVYMAYVFAGLAIGRSNLLSRAFQVKALAVGVALMCIGYGSSWFLTNHVGPSETDWKYDLRSSDMSQSAGTPEQPGPLTGGVVSPYDPVENPLTNVTTDDLRNMTGEDLDTKLRNAYGYGILLEASYDDMSSMPMPPNETLPHLFRWNPAEFPDVRMQVTAAPHSNTIFEAVGSGGFAIAVLALLLLLGALARTVLFPFAVVGSMSLTAYITHLIVIGCVTTPFDYHPDSGVLLWLILGVTLGCNLWRFINRRGPLEWITWKTSMVVGRLAGPEPTEPNSVALNEASIDPEQAEPSVDPDQGGLATEPTS